VYLCDLAALLATWHNVRFHAGLVIDAWRRRRLIELGRQAADRAFDLSVDPRDAWQQTDAEILSLSAQTAASPVVHAHGLFAALADQVDQASQSTAELVGLDTGLPNLNHLTGGIRPGNLFLIAARPSVGKTALALQMAVRAAEAGVSVLVFSLEMSRDELGYRLISQQTSIDSRRLRLGRLRAEEWMPFSATLARLADLPLAIDDTGALGLVEARARARQLHHTQPLGLIVVDYLQLMTVTGYHSREQEVSAVSRGLKALAKELQVPVLALSQLSRAVEIRADRRPQLSDLRESGGLEQDADQVLFIWRPEPPKPGNAGDPGAAATTPVELILAKERNGPTGSVYCRWRPEATVFVEEAPQWRQPAPTRPANKHWTN
jgi:replicative DNA helicase